MMPSSYEDVRCKKIEENKKRMDALKLSHLSQSIYKPSSSTSKPSSMVDKRKLSKSPKSNKPHKRPARPTPEQSQVPLPSTTSHVPHPSTTLHAAPTSRTPNILPTSRSPVVAPTSKTPHGAPTSKMPYAAPTSKTSHVAPTARISHDAPIPRTSTTTTTSPGTSLIAPLPRTSSHVTPPTSIRGVDSPLVSQPSHSEEPPLETSETVAASETQSNVGELTLFLDGDGFLPSYPAANSIAEILKSYFNEPWPSWKKVPSGTRDMWFGEFKKTFSICPPDDRWARKNFEKRGATVMKNNLNKARTRMNRLSWITEDIWPKLCEHWASQPYKKKRIQAKTNRASDCGGFGVSLHCCGSITASQHKDNMNAGVPPNFLELFRRTHQHSKDKTWVDKRSEHVDREFTRKLDDLTQEASLHGMPPPNPLKVWTDVAGVKKGRIYGLGMESSVLAGRAHYRGSGSYSTEWVQRHELEEMKNERDQLREELTKTNQAVEHQYQLIKQMMETMNFQLKQHSIDQDNEEGQANDDDDLVDDDDSVDDDEELGLEAQNIPE